MPHSSDAGQQRFVTVVIRHHREHAAIAKQGEGVGFVAIENDKASCEAGVQERDPDGGLPVDLHSSGGAGGKGVAQKESRHELSGVAKPDEIQRLLDRRDFHLQAVERRVHRLDHLAGELHVAADEPCDDAEIRIFRAHLAQQPGQDHRARRQPDLLQSKLPHLLVARPRRRACSP